MLNCYPPLFRSRIDIISRLGTLEFSKTLQNDLWVTIHKANPGIRKSVKRGILWNIVIGLGLFWIVDVTANLTSPFFLPLL